MIVEYLDSCSRPASSASPGFLTAALVTIIAWPGLMRPSRDLFDRMPSGRVEAAVARRLPHRSGLAAFPHPALLMSNPVSSRSSSPDVHEPRRRQRVGAQKSIEPKNGSW